VIAALPSDVRRAALPRRKLVLHVGLRPRQGLDIVTRTVSGRSPIQLSKLAGGAKPPLHIERRSRHEGLRQS